MTIRETDDIWRLYVREWVIVHTITMSAVTVDPVVEVAEAWAEKNLAGRVRPDDIRFDGGTDSALLYWVHVLVFKENLKGEFKHYSGAEYFAVNQGYEEYVIVPRNSKTDHDIRSYGVRMLGSD